jgi:hypothetical protein
MMRGLKAIAVALLLTSVGYCQNEQKSTTTTEQKQTAGNETADTYRLDIVIRELQEGKLVSTRDYTALVQEHAYRPRTIKIGSRLPIGGTPGNPSVQYFDVGTNLNFHIRTIEGRLILSLNAEVSSVAVPDSSNTKASEYPIVRQFRTDQEAAIPLGKPTLLNSVDDPNSNHKFQIEVTATKEKA